ncbi:MAG: DUF2156 domain-containing protein [Candidatus Aminicenantes bacterium]|nr:DUF2156 domain-containing protein [Candidatus Aminicenantes bacterium]
MMKIKLEDFSPVTLDDKQNIQPLLMADDVFFCDYSFPNLFTWGEIFKTRWLIDDERLWLYNGYDDMMLMPVGKALTLSEMVAVSDMMLRAGKNGDFVLVGEDFVKENPELERFFKVEIDHDNGDYIYSSQKLVELAGNKLRKKRNQINQFLESYPDYTSSALQSSDLDACLDLSKRWCRQRTCLELDFTHETSALKKAFLHFDALELQGLKINHGQDLMAFSVFSRLNSNMADVHFEKFDPLSKGASQIINCETAKLLSGKYKYINREQDLGIEGLRRAKKSYEPEYIVCAYFLERKK